MTAFRKGDDPRRWRGGRVAHRKITDPWAFMALWYDVSVTVAEIATRYRLSQTTIAKAAKRFGFTPRMQLLEAAKMGPWKRKAA